MMRKTATILLYIVAAVMAAPDAYSAAFDSGPRQLSGVWWGGGSQQQLVPADGQPLPLSAEGRRRYQSNADGFKAHIVQDDAQYLCLPEGMPRAMTSAYPFQIIMSPGQVTFAHEANRAYRIVNLDKPHADPGKWDPSFMGDGVGRWDGDTLVIDSTNFKADRIYLDSSGLPASEQLHLIEHLKLMDNNRRLEELIEIDDPVIFTKRWTARLTFSRRDDVQLQVDWVCGEKHRDLKSLARAPSEGVSIKPSDVSPGHTALSGYWGTWTAFRTSMASGHPEQAEAKDFAAAATKLQPWAKAIYDKAVATDAAGVFVPSNTTACYPDWIAGSGIYDAYGMEILVEPRQVTFLSEAGRSMRFVYIDQPRPRSLQPTWSGHSIGHWDGDTLVVDTIGFNERSSLPFRVPMTPKMHVVERLRVIDGSLEDQATYDDPGAFTAPFSVTTRFDRGKPYQEYICAENNHEGGVPTADGGTTKSDLPKDKIQ